MHKETMKSLADVPAGSSAAMVALQGGKGFVNRMASLGFTPGTEVQVVQNYRRGPIITLVRGTRVALGLILVVGILALAFGLTYAVATPLQRWLDVVLVQGAIILNTLILS